MSDLSTERLLQLQEVRAELADVQYHYKALEAAYLKAEAECARFKAALEKVRSYNVDIIANRINYRPRDHIQVIDAALTPKGSPDLDAGRQSGHVAWHEADPQLPNSKPCYTARTAER